MALYDTAAIVDDIKNFHITCPICTEIYCRPKVLTCLHTFCEACLRDYVIAKMTSFHQQALGQNNGIAGVNQRQQCVLCPLCNQPTNLTGPGDVSALPDNHYIESLKATIFQNSNSAEAAALNTSIENSAYGFASDCILGFNNVPAASGCISASAAASNIYNNYDYEQQQTVNSGQITSSHKTSPSYLEIEYETAKPRCSEDDAVYEEIQPPPIPERSPVAQKTPASTTPTSTSSTAMLGLPSTGTVALTPQNLSGRLGYGVDISRRREVDYVALGKFGTNDIDFNKVIGLCAKNPGEYVVSDQYNNRVLAIHEDGYVMHVFRCPGNSAVACVCFDDQENLLVVEASTGGGQVSHYKMNGFRSKVFADKFLKYNHPLGLAFNKIDRTIILTSTEPSLCYVFDAVSGQMLHKFGQSANGRLRQATFVAVAGDHGDRIAIVDAGDNSVKVFRRDGTFQFQLGSGGVSGKGGSGNKENELLQPKDITVDAKGNFIVCDSGNRRLLRYRDDGKFKDVLIDFRSEDVYPQNIVMETRGADTTKLCVFVVGKNVAELRIYPYNYPDSKIGHGWNPFKGR